MASHSRLSTFASDWRGTRRLRCALLATSAILLVAPLAVAQDTDELVGEDIVVEGDIGVVTEGTDAYTTTRATVGGRQPQDVREVPQSVTVLTRQRLDDAGATTIEEAAYGLPGLQTATGDGFQGSLYARGQEVFQYYVDGAKRPYLSIYGTAPDLFFFDRLEFIAGPSGVFQGTGEPVGTLNLVRKRPLDESGLILGLEGDSYGGYRGEVDVTAPFTEDGSIRGRFAAIAEQGESHVDYLEQDRYSAYGTVEFDFGEQTTLAVGGIIDHIDRAGFSGLPTFTDGSLIPFDRDTFIGSLYDASDTDSYELFAELEHEFDYGGVAKATVRFYDRDVSLLSALPSSGVDPTSGDFAMINFAREYAEEELFADLNLTSPFEFSGVDGEVVVGVDFRTATQDFKQNFDFSPGTQNINTFNPFTLVQPSVTFPGVGPGFRLNTVTEVNEYGLYAQARAEVAPGLKLNAGARVSFYEETFRDTGRNITREVDHVNFVPFAGATYDLTDEITAFGSFATIFEPQGTTPLATGGNAPARKGRQFEAGLKGEFYDGDLQVQTSVYHIRDRNRAFSVGGGLFGVSPQADTMGFELQVTGSPYPGVELSAGYTYVDTDLNNDPTPQNNFVAFGKYTFEDGALDGLSLGAGVRAASGFSNFDLSSNVDIVAPGYTVFDAFIGYELTENLSMQVNVRNLFDLTYYERVNQVTRGNFYGEPLNATLKLTAEF